MSSTTENSATGSHMDWLQRIPAPYQMGCSRPVFEMARQSYESPGRHYHTWTHIENCLQHFLATKFDSPQPVLLALLFHDAIYVPGAKDNETKSAQLALETLASHSSIGESDRTLVHRMILLTADHHAGSSLTKDEAQLIDIDLSILGSPWPQYETYMRGVEAEYCPAVTTNSRFRVGRLAFLRKMLRQPNVFLSNSFRTAYDQNARNNMEREVDLLSREQGLGEKIVSLLYRG